MRDHKHAETYRLHHGAMNAKILLEAFRRIGAP
jgi:hypothetical protein